MKIENPWIGFAHPDHQPEELEPLVRTLRYAWIDLQKFWVELQSIPVFMSGLKACNLDEIEKILRWTIDSPPWADQIESPRLVQELAQPESRKRIQEFAKSVLCVRSLLQEVEAKIGFAPKTLSELDQLWKKLSEGATIASRRSAEGAKGWTRVELETKLIEANRSWNESAQSVRFFAMLSEKLGAPRATRASEGLTLIRALEAIEQTPVAIRSWRSPHVLEASQKIRLQAWRDRARPILDLRKRLESYFNLEAEVTVDDLNRLSDALKADGLFSQFKAPYREALEKYRGLLRGAVAQKVDSKINGFQKGEKLKEWVSLLEQTRAFAQQAEAKQAFAPHFNGIDTDFASALEANAWAKSLKDEFFTQNSDPSSVRQAYQDRPVDGVSLAFDTSVIAWITGIAEEKFSLVASILQGPELAQMRVILPTLSDEAFEQIELSRKKLCWDLRKLKELSTELLLPEALQLGALKALSERIEEAYFLIQRMESDAALKASLKEVYAGVDTDLTLIEPCAAYVKAVKSAAVPGGLESSLLSMHGPQRLSDARGLAVRCLQSLVLVRDHYRKLEVATRDEVRSISNGRELEMAPVVELMDRIQSALKNAQHLAEAIAELQANAASGGSKWVGLKVEREADASHSACLNTAQHESRGD